MLVKKIKFTKEELVFYQSKYDYYHSAVRMVPVLSSLAMITYWVSDCQLSGRLAWQTLPARVLMALLLPLYLKLDKKLQDFRQILLVAYLFAHGVVWNTIWAICYLPDRSQVGEGFLCFQFMFLMLGFATPVRMSVIGHSFLLVDMLGMYLLTGYGEFPYLLSIGVPILVTCEIMIAYMEKHYKEHYRLTEEMKRHLVTDQLTGAYNRHFLSQICKGDTEELKWSRVGLAELDVDYFKRVNDSFGHDVGDQVLVKLVELVKLRLRPEDYCIRMGGEEFFLFFPGYSSEQVADIVEQIREDVEEYEEGRIRFTISVGVSEYEGGNYRLAMKQTDSALYNAKQTGRNCVRIY